MRFSRRIERAQRRMREIERALPVRRLDDARHHQEIRTQHDQLLERHVAAIAARARRPAASARPRASARRQGFRGRRCSRCCRPASRSTISDAAPRRAARAPPRSRRSAPRRARDGRAASRSRGSARRRTSRSFTSGDADDAEAEHVQHALRQRAVPRADQHEVGLERDHGLRRAAEQRIFAPPARPPPRSRDRAHWATARRSGRDRRARSPAGRRRR